MVFWPSNDHSFVPLLCRTACTLVSPYGRVTPGNGINKLILLTCDMAPDSLLHTKINIFFNYYRLSTYQDSIIILWFSVPISYHRSLVSHSKDNKHQIRPAVTLKSILIPATASYLIPS